MKGHTVTRHNTVEATAAHTAERCYQLARQIESFLYVNSERLTTEQGAELLHLRDAARALAGECGRAAAWTAR